MPKKRWMPTSRSMARHSPPSVCPLLRDASMRPRCASSIYRSAPVIFIPPRHTLSSGRRRLIVGYHQRRVCCRGAWHMTGPSRCARASASFCARGCLRRSRRRHRAGGWSAAVTVGSIRGQGLPPLRRWDDPTGSGQRCPAHRRWRRTDHLTLLNRRQAGSLYSRLNHTTG